MKKIFKYFLIILLIHFFILIFITLFTLINMENVGIVEYIRETIKIIITIPINYNRRIDKYIIYLFQNINIFLWINLFYLIYLILKQILINKLSENTKSKMIYYFILVTSIIILLRQVFVLFYGEELFDLIGDIFSTFILFLYIIYTALVESYIIPIFNIFHLHKKNVEFGKYHKVLVILNIIFLIRALFYSGYYLISFFDY